MDLNEYQKRAMTTCMASSNNFAYMALNLVGEVGEFASKIAKSIRKEDYAVNCNEIYVNDRIPEAVAMSKAEDEKGELGDILWQLAGLCKVRGYTLEEIAQANLEKLASRKSRGVIDGNGDNR